MAPILTSLPSTDTTTLYEFASTVEQSPGALQVSPATFKSMVSSLFDLLIEQNLPAWVWVKLPRGDSWQMEIDRCAIEAESLRGLYVFRSAAEDTTDPEMGLGGSNKGFVDSVLTSHFQSAALSSIQLPAENPLKGEFLVMAWSESMSVLLAAQRGKAKRTIAEAVTPTSELADVAEDTPDRKMPLLVTCLFEPTVVRSSIHSLTNMMQEKGYELLSGQGKPLPMPQSWEQILEQSTPTGKAASDWVAALFSKHIQRQEELWQRSSTYRKQAELVNVLQLQNEELANTVRSKDEFLNNVGQELRTPLTNMKTALTLLNSPNIKPPQRQRYMDLLTKECDRQSSLIGSLLDLVSLDQMAERKTLESIKLADVVPGVVSTYQPLSEEKGVRLAYTVPEDLPPVANLNPWLRQIVVNLLHNGIKFTPRGGQVWVRAKQQGDYIQLEFKDTGVGIPVNEIPKIFDRFYRVRQVSSEDAVGAGLGLTIVQQLLLRCGGSIQVKSRPGEGSIFNVLLPVYKDLNDRID
jgi:two-component system, OmpR family, phosphate regulon sensor histidine kinase PhoR